MIFTRHAAIAIVDSLLKEALEKIAKEAGHLLNCSTRSTLSSRDIQTAVRLVLPAELAKHAIAEGVRAVMKYASGESKGSKSTRAGLTFSVPLIKRMLLGIVPGRIGATAPVYLTAVMEYLCAEVLELAGTASKDMKTKHLMPRHVLLALRGDEELDGFWPGTVASGGVIPHIHMGLIRKAET